MEISTQKQAVLLLTSYFYKQVKDEPTPLTLGEWGRFARWLKERNLKPEDLLIDAPEQLLSDFHDKKITPDRIKYLVNRGSALALAMEKWQRSGLWVLIRSDEDYPVRLRKHLKWESPPILFGCGNRKLLNKEGIAIIGSRNASKEELQFASALGKTASEQGYCVISGGARGIDEQALLGALEIEGTAVAVLSDSLLRVSTSSKYRNALMAKNLALVSPFYPEAGFEVGNAMARNKYIYCMSEAAVVVSSAVNKGGTWSGAIEDLRKKWVPLWVKPSENATSGNQELVRRGAAFLPEGTLDLKDLFKKSPEEQVDKDFYGNQQYATELLRFMETTGDSPDLTPPEISSLYELFLRHFEHLTAKIPMSAEELCRQFDIGKTQLDNWLKRALEEGHIQKVKKRPARYQRCTETTQDIPDLSPSEVPNLYDLFLRQFAQLTAKNPLTVEELSGGLDIGKSQLNNWLKSALEEGRAKKFKNPVCYQWNLSPDLQISMEF